MSKSPWPYRMEYETWLELRPFDLDGRLARFVIYPLCVLLTKLMRVWPHKHETWIEMDNHSIVCLYCFRIVGDVRNGDRPTT